MTDSLAWSHFLSHVSPTTPTPIPSEISPSRHNGYRLDWSLAYLDQKRRHEPAAQAQTDPWEGWLPHRPTPCTPVHSISHEYYSTIR